MTPSWRLTVPPQPPCPLPPPSPAPAALFSQPPNPAPASLSHPSRPGLPVALSRPCRPVRPRPPSLLFSPIKKNKKLSQKNSNLAPFHLSFFLLHVIFNQLLTGDPVRITLVCAPNTRFTRYLARVIPGDLARRARDFSVQFRVTL